jgi:TonB family protein
MKYVWCTGILVWPICLTLVFAQNKTSSAGQNKPQASNSNDEQPPPLDLLEFKGSPIDILSDTNGVDVRPYLKRSVVPKIKANWYDRIPASARAPLMKKGRVSIRFRLMKDGKIVNLNYHDGSGDIALDHAAYDSIAVSSPLPPLPSEFACQYVELQFHFYYNPSAGDFVQEKGPPKVPCVTTKIRLGEAPELTVSPGSAEVVIGAKQQFLAILSGVTSPVVTWSIGGPGCEASTCGFISPEGFYTAPGKIPSPGTITVTAILAISAASPAESGSATVTIVQSGASRQ